MMLRLGIREGRLATLTQLGQIRSTVFHEVEEFLLASLIDHPLQPVCRLDRLPFQQIKLVYTSFVVVS